MPDTPYSPNDQSVGFATADPVGRLAMWTASGVPLPAMLRTLAEEMGGREANAFEQLADRVESGESLEHAFAATSSLFPARLRRQLAVAAESGDLAAMLPALSVLRETSRSFAHQTLSILAYPAIVLVAVLGIVMLFSLLLAPQFEAIFDDFQLSLPVITIAVLALSRLAPFLSVVLLAAALIAAVLWRLPLTARWMHWFATALPLLGRVWVCHGHKSLVHLLSACTAAGMTSATALRTAAAGLTDRNLAHEAVYAAARCESGESLAGALAASKHFERPLTAMVAWGEGHGALPAALAEAVQVYDHQSSQVLTLLRRVAPPLLLTVVILFVSLAVIGLFLPLVSLIECLS